MSKLDDILNIEQKDYGAKVLKLIDVNQAKQAIIDYFIELVGDDELNTMWRVEREEARNELRRELRQKIREE